MRPILLVWLAAAAAAAAPAAETPQPPATTTAAPSPAPSTEAPAPTAATVPTTVPPPSNLAALFFPHAMGGQMRSLDGQGGGVGEAAQAVPWLASLARSFPVSLRAFDKPAQSREAVSAIEEFTGPLVRFATGGQPVAADVEQLIDSIPHLARSANAMKEADKVNLSSMDITSLPANIVSHVLSGGEIPGIDRAELDRVVREHLKRMSEAADRVMSGEHVENLEKILPPLDKLPTVMVMTSLQGKPLPGLSADETAKIREYYTKQLPSNLPSDKGEQPAPLPEHLSALGNMVKLLPPNYDIGKIPPQFIQSVMAGQVPDLTLLPTDLQKYLNAGKDQAMSIVRTLNSSVTEIVQQLQLSVAKMPEVMRAAEPYDISKVSHEVVDHEASKDKQNRYILYTVVWFAVAIVMATIVIACLLYKKFASAARKAPPGALTPPARDTDAMPRALPADDSPAAAAAAAGCDTMSPSGTMRRRVAASSPDTAAEAEFAAKAARFSTPKLHLQQQLDQLQLIQELQHKQQMSKLQQQEEEEMDDESGEEISWNKTE